MPVPVAIVSIESLYGEISGIQHMEDVKADIMQEGQPYCTHMRMYQ